MIYRVTKKVIFFLSFIFTPYFSLAASLTACYDVKVFFFKVGESCITYKIESNILKISSSMKTVNIGSLAKRINDHGSSELILDKFTPKKFIFYQEEGSFKRYQEYNFKDNKIFVIERKYKKLTDDIEREENKVYNHNGELDPYNAALYLFKKFQSNSSGMIPIFYDDKFYKIPWTNLEKTSLQTSLGEMKCQKLMIKPYIKGKGLLQPKGDWILYIDEKSLLPIRMEIGFLIGSIKVELVSMTGDIKLISKLKN